MNEYEVIQHPQIRGLHIFFNSMEYRTPHFHAEWELLCPVENKLTLHLLMMNIPYHRMNAEEIAHRDSRNERIQHLLRYVDEHFRERINLRSFAYEEGLSMHYLSGFIRKALNQSFQEYVATVRFNYACERMVKTDDKLLTISLDSGFSDYRYFSDAFRKRTGKTPDEYRAVLRAGGHSNNFVRHSMHSREKFFTRKESLSLCQELDDLWK